MLIVLIGPHGAGKTTLGRALGARLGVPFHHEIGRELAEDPCWRPAGATAADEQAAFDDEVFARELARDATWPAGAPRIVETWHIGNLAYARLRGSWITAERRLAGIRAGCARFDPVVVPVRAPAAVLRQRQTEPGNARFFMAAGREAERLAHALSLRTLAPIWTHCASPAALATKLASRIGALSDLRPPCVLGEGAAP